MEMSEPQNVKVLSADACDRRRARLSTAATSIGMRRVRCAEGKLKGRTTQAGGALQSMRILGLAEQRRQW